MWNRFKRRLQDARTGLLILAMAAAPAYVSSLYAAQTDTSLTTLDGATLRLSDYRGQWLVLNYWATWCKPCREEMPALDALDRGRDDVRVVGIAWENTSPEALRAFLKKMPVGYPIVPMSPFEPAAGVEAPKVLPTTLLIDPDGEVSERFYGPVTRTLLEQAIINSQRPDPS